MRSHPLFGLLLAVFGALVLTPDTLYMRPSVMEGYQMVAWRGLLTGSVMLCAWALTSRNRRGEAVLLASGAGLLVVACQYVNATLFNLAIAAAPSLLASLNRPTDLAAASGSSAQPTEIHASAPRLPTPFSLLGSSSTPC